MYWYMRSCVEFEEIKNAFQMHKRLFYSTCTHTHTHTYTHRVNIDVHILMSLLFEIYDNFSNVTVRMMTNDARCSAVVEHIAPGQTLATGVEVGVPLSLGYDECGRVV